MLAKDIKLQTKNNCYELKVYNCSLKIENENPVFSPPLLTNSVYFGGMIDRKISLSFDIEYSKNYDLIRQICYESIISFSYDSYKIHNIVMSKFKMDATQLTYSNPKIVTTIYIEFNSFNKDYLDQEFYEKYKLRNKIESLELF